MKMADILRSLADKLDGIEGGGEIEQPANTGATVDNVDDSDNTNNDIEITGVMVPPLQAKLELLKKATGVDSHYDSEGSDELDDIKKLTGLKAVIAQEAGEDNDITG
jgi:hypothetical protein